MERQDGARAAAEGRVSVGGQRAGGGLYDNIRTIDVIGN